MGIKSKKWLITGGCGYIGGNLVRKLLSGEGCSIRVVDNLSVGNRGDLAQVTSFKEHAAPPVSVPVPGQVELIPGDILDLEFMLSASRGMDTVVHLAANTGVAPSVKDPIMDCRTNVLGSLNCLEAARRTGVERFIFASSGAPAGEVSPPIHEDLPARPVSPYGAGKLAGEGYCSAYFRSYGVKTAALRFGNVYGPGSANKTSVVAKFIQRAMAGKPCEIYGDGNQTRDFIYVDDVVDAIERSARLSPGGEIYQIATSTERTVLEVAEIIRDRLDTLCGIKMEIVFSEPRQGDVLRNYSDTSKAERVLGWKSREDFVTGIDKTVEYFINLTK